MHRNIRHVPLCRRLRLPFDWHLHMGMHRPRSDVILWLPHDDSILSPIDIISSCKRSNLGQHEIKCSASFLVTATPKPQQASIRLRRRDSNLLTLRTRQFHLLLINRMVHMRLQRRHRSFPPIQRLGLHFSPQSSSRHGMPALPYAVLVIQRAVRTAKQGAARLLPRRSIRAREAGRRLRQGRLVDVHGWREELLCL